MPRLSRNRRYQNGTLELAATSSGPTWYIRFTKPDGRRPRVRIGLKSQFPTKAKASRAAQSLRETFNSSPDLLFTPNFTFGDVVARYEREEMPERFSTRRGYLRMHRLYIVPRWGSTPLAEIAPLEVRAWLRSLAGAVSGRKLSTRSLGHLHTQMKNLFKHAQLWRWIPAQVNPLSLFSIAGATKRTKKPRVISPAQFRALLEYFAETGGFHAKRREPHEVLRMQVLLTTDRKSTRLNSSH